MRVEKINKEACVIITKREQAKELYSEIDKSLKIIREEGTLVTRVLEDTKRPEGKVKYIINGMNEVKVKNILSKTLQESIEKRAVLA
ncbi:hypothetical protein HF875_08000 [Paraclostridium bifermentans]|uniref:Uncharacterized protein n=1 Tax=Paraclostridium bifermentans TaxID=1490 RepID=A0AA44IH51_PARBF|nr:hypothetical protein [Paraclostridium bifermentans]NME09459.1 hypothetical protein [Paraclostridium bifermentans]